MTKNTASGHTDKVKHHSLYRRRVGRDGGTFCSVVTRFVGEFGRAFLAAMVLVTKSDWFQPAFR
jgi:hypothetical protein